MLSSSSTSWLWWYGDWGLPSSSHRGYRRGGGADAVRIVVEDGGGPDVWVWKGPNGVTPVQTASSSDWGCDYDCSGYGCVGRSSRPTLECNSFRHSLW